MSAQAVFSAEHLKFKNLSNLKKTLDMCGLAYKVYEKESGIINGYNDRVIADNASVVLTDVFNTYNMYRNAGFVKDAKTNEYYFVVGDNDDSDSIRTKIVEKLGTGFKNTNLVDILGQVYTAFETKDKFTAENGYATSVEATSMGEVNVLVECYI